MYKKNQDWLKPEGVELNSKWNEAEKYICNPLSGEVPMECLSSKTLNSISFRDVSNKSTPLMNFPSNHNLNNSRTSNPNVRIIQEDHVSTDPVLIQGHLLSSLLNNNIIKAVLCCGFKISLGCF